ncbi:MAG TPA: MBL fold metallo-hydrolase, partial [Firmicutes bacterium]|nr:MBL fold metallo-hydrolase [Bacillota bacterium]
MRIKRIVVGALETNCYIISCEETGEAVVVDPGAEPDRVLRETQGLEVV